jgi:glycine cleavage system pyridoxal-binding protein P
LEKLARRVAASTEATKRAVLSIDGVELVDPKAANFREFAVILPIDAAAAVSYADAAGINAGFDLGVWWADYGMSRCLLIGCDERTSQSDIEALVSALSQWVSEVSV